MKISHLVKRISTRRCHSTRTGPEPYPDPHNIGIDIALVSRFQDIIVKGQFSKYRELYPPTSNTTEHPFRLLYKRDAKPPELLEAFIRKTFNYVEWRDVRERLVEHLHGPSDSFKLARFLASRWAAKEAAIKAYSSRRLHYRDVIIASQPIHDLQKRVPVALINPPKAVILMTDEVARMRGLAEQGIMSDRKDDSPRSRRLAQTIMSERKIARLSISHDGDYATAVVQAWDVPGELFTKSKITDNGDGDPIHEPYIGDEGFDTYDLATAMETTVPEQRSQ